MISPNRATRRRVRLGAALGAALVSIGLGGCANPAPSGTVPEALAGNVLTSLPSEGVTPLLVDFDGKVQLVGYSVEPREPLAPGSRISLTLYWRSVAVLGEGWSLFTHVNDARGGQVVNGDDVGPLRQRAGRGSPQALGPSEWRPGFYYKDEQQLELPATLATPEVSVLVGVWSEFAFPAGKDDAGAPLTRPHGARLTILSGPNAGADRALVVHLPTTWKAPPAPAGSAAP